MRSPFSAGSALLQLAVVLLLTGCGYDGPAPAEVEDGQSPLALIRASDGNFYGVTRGGGAFGQGTMFRITPAGDELVLYSFAGGSFDGSAPQSLMQASDGNFYGTTPSGGTTNCKLSGAVPVSGLSSLNTPVGCGTVFKVTPDGSETVLYYFQGKSDGEAPAALIQGNDGLLYGIAGGGANGAGVLFRITASDEENVVYSFTQENFNGVFPIALMQASDGDFYVTTSEGGATYQGAVVRISPQGAESLLYSSGVGFDVTPLIQAADGTFYGIAQSEADGGTFYRLTSTGAATVLYDFNSDRAEGYSPAILLADGAGTFYGFAAGGGLLSSCGGGCGALFQITSAGVESAIYRFPALTPAPNETENTYVSALVLGQDGNLYGTTSGDGEYYYGTFFRVTPSGVFTALHSFGPN